jgi:phytol kinase
MNWFLDKAIGFFIANFPSPQMIAFGGPLGLAWSLACLWFAGRLKRNGMRTGYTRKVFHFLIFGTVAALQWSVGTPAVCLFGGLCTLVVFFAVWRGAGNLLYEAIAREKDEPHRTFFVLVPYATTLIGGLVTNILFGQIALAGYLVTGLGDAIGEPVGTRFGHHPYRVPSLSSVPATRTVEGSTAVFFMSAVALAVATILSPRIAFASFGIVKLLVIALVCAIAEAVSPHGWDNATLQIVPCTLVWMWLG